jgi:enoyl-CoA hydratase/carnithine racemase
VIARQRQGDVAIIILDRPEKRNALTPEMFAALRAAIEDARAGSAAALLLAGNGPVFCGGFDLALCAQRPGTLQQLLEQLFETIALLRSLAFPVVIAAHSAAIAGGCALLGGADIVIADRGARFGYPVITLGISPAVSAPFLRLAVGDGPCRTRLLEAALISAADALRQGLVHELVEAPEAVRPRALELAGALAAKPRHAMAATRTWIAEVERELFPVDPRRGLEASLALTGNQEERQRLADLLK